MTNETTHHLRQGFVAQQTENGGWFVQTISHRIYEPRVTKAFSSDADFVNFIVTELGCTPERSKLVAAALDALEAGPIEAPYIGHTTGE